MKKIILGLAAAVIILTVYFFNALAAPSNQSGKVNFVITSGESLKSIAKNLEQDGLIKNDFIFRIYAKLKKQQGNVLAGRYSLAQNMNARAVLAALTSSESLNNEKTITIIEGWRATEIGAYLERQGVVSPQDFLDSIATDKWREEFDFLSDVGAATVEGFLFPDTYRIFTAATAEDIVRKMLGAFDLKLTKQLRQDIAGQNKSIFDVVTLASIVEREVPKDDDKKIIADIFLKRLAAGIALQSDATVNYATGGKRLQPTAADLAVDSLYNTYKYRGLPPGPIANPGLGSIEAVVYPTKNPYYYFLTAPDDGRVIYSRTYEEHLANKKKYLD